MFQIRVTNVNEICDSHYNRYLFVKTVFRKFMYFDLRLVYKVKGYFGSVRTTVKLAQLSLYVDYQYEVPSNFVQ
jgi:hypothetical protein